MTPYSKIFKKLFPVRRAFEDIPPPKDGRAANTMMNERYQAEKGPLMNKGKADESSSTLLEDLDRYSSEVYYKRDLKAGLGILKEVAGAVSVGGFSDGLDAGGRDHRLRVNHRSDHVSRGSRL